MQLAIGERLEGSGPEQQPGGYVVTGVVSETPWYGLYAAKKVFYNFDFTAKRVRETDEREWLDVFLRTIRYPILDQAEYVSRRRALARAEVRTVLGGRHSNLWPEPIDLLELDESRDPFSFVGDGADARDAEPIVVFARPHGMFLPAWLKQIRPMTSVLAVLAELLEFISQAHAEGLLLLGLAPESVVVDGLERVHFVGTDMALAQSSPLLTEKDGEAWGRYFPPERFPRGYAAPECFHAGGRPDRRSDLYSWGTLVYWLLTDDSPVQVAQGQARMWAQWQPEHFARLENALGQLPKEVRAGWAEELGVPASALPPDWPHHLAGAFQLLLNPNPNRRPQSVAELRRWLLHLPPPAVAGMAAVQVFPGEAKLLVDCSALDDGLHLRVRRGRGTAPQSPQEGETVYDGPVRPVVVDSEVPVGIDPEPFFYTIWTTKGANGQATYSAGVTERLWQPDAASLLRWTELQAAGLDQIAYPPRVSMVLGVLDPLETATTLARSASPRVRGWGLRRIEQGLRASLRFGEAEPVLWQFLHDPLGEIRLAAAQDVWTHADPRDDELLLRLLEAMEVLPLDGSPPLFEFLRRIGQPEPRITQLMQLLELRRPTTCPLCRQPLTMGDRARHLRETHGYIDFEGDAVPYAVALTRLWDRVLHQQNATAHNRLLALYTQTTPVGAPGPPGLPRYAADLGKQVLGQALTGGALAPAAPLALPFAAFDAYLALLRKCEPFLPIVRLILALDNPRLRDLGREAILPVLAERLRGSAGGADAIWAALEGVCPGADMIEERLRLCHRLPSFGADAAAVSACAARLQDERLIRCTECQAHVRSKDIEAHLRRAHHIHEFRGVRRSFEETRDALVEAVCTTPPDLKAWTHLRELVHDHHPQDAEQTLVAWLYQHLKALGSEQRPGAVVGLAEALATGGGPALLSLLVGPAKNVSYAQLGRRLALELSARLPAPVSAETLAHVKPLLSDKELPRKGRQRAVLALLRTTGRDGAAALDLLHAYVAGSGKVRAIEKLHQIEQRFGQAPAIDALCSSLEEEVRMTCPRCPTQLRRKDMVRHVWERHGLVLDGQRVREPWRVLEDWAVDYRLEKDAELLRRCRELAAQVDPADGVNRLHRILLKDGMEDRDILAALVAQARAKDSSLCPHCFHFVPGLPEAPAPKPLLWDGDVLEGFGYRLEVSERGPVPTLRIESPDEVLYNSREPGRWVTRLAGLGCVIPVIPLLYVLIWGITHWPAILIFMLAAAPAIILGGLLYGLWPAPPPSELRLLRAAWNRLVPQMLSEPFGRNAWSFLHALARFSEESAFHPRADRLEECVDEVLTSGTGDPLAAVTAARISQLQLAQLRDFGVDILAVAADLVGGCFQGNVSPPVRCRTASAHPRLPPRVVARRAASSPGSGRRSRLHCRLTGRRPPRPRPRLPHGPRCAEPGGSLALGTTRAALVDDPEPRLAIRGAGG
jgi:uncharacterized C2H2 Zn-finger protein